MFSFLISTEYIGSLPESHERDSGLQLQLKKLRQRGKGHIISVCELVLNPVSTVSKRLNVDPETVIIWEILMLYKRTPCTVLHLGNTARSVDAVRIIQGHKGGNNISVSTEPVEFASHIKIGNDFDDLYLELNEIMRICSDIKRVTPSPIDLVVATEGKPWHQSHLALCALKDDGEFVLEMNELYNSNHQILIWILNQVFTSVHISKPATSRILSTQKFVACTGFKKNKFNEEFRDLLPDAVGRPTLLADTCPISWFSYITAIQKKFTAHRESWQRKTVELVEIMIKSKKATEEFKNDCLNDSAREAFLEKFIESQLKINHMHIHDEEVSRDPYDQETYTRLD